MDGLSGRAILNRSHCKQVRTPIGLLLGPNSAPQTEHERSTRSTLITYCGAKHTYIDVILYIWKSAMCRSTDHWDKRMNICDIRDERLLADDDTVEPPDAQEIVTSPRPLGMMGQER